MDYNKLIKEKRIDIGYLFIKNEKCINEKILLARSFPFFPQL